MKILIRRLHRKLSFSLLNVLGLTVGIAASLLIFLLIRYELSIDRFHTKRDRIYRVIATETFSNGVTDNDGCSPIQLPDALRNEFPGIEQVAATMRIGTQQFAIPSPGNNQEKILRADDVYYADPSLFKIFDFPWIAGVPEIALKEPGTAAITRSLADNWFIHWQDAIGKIILLGDRRIPYRITGIINDLPSNTDIAMKVVLSYASFRIMQGSNMTYPGNWDSFNTESQCFFSLPAGQSIQPLNAMLPGFINRHFTPLYAASHVKDSCLFQPLKEMHFNNRIFHYGKDAWSYSDLMSLGLIGIFLLVVACINFINLSTAQSLNRAKEVGVRKLLGSSRSRLLRSFLEETGLLVIISIILGYALAGFCLPYINQLLGKQISLSLWESPSTLLFLTGTWIAVTLLAGFYPGLILSRFDPLAAVKNKTGVKTGGSQNFRRGLVVLQFAIAQILLIGTLIVVRQMTFLRNQPTGFERKDITLIHLPESESNSGKFAYFKSRVLQIPGVRSASLCDAPPSTNNGWNTTYLTLGNNTHNEDFEIEHRYTDTNYLSTFKMALKAGRYPYPSDTIKETVLNETAVRRLGFKSPEAIIGKTISLEGRPYKKIPVVGVVMDFNSVTLKQPIRPLAMFTAASSFSTLAVRMDPSGIGPTIGRLQEVFANNFPGQTFDAPFFDDTVLNYYNAEAITARLFRIFTILAIFISCLGLYGLVSFMVVQKTKEVGIRKVLGASVQNIVYLFSSEFTLLIGIAFVIAAPLGYFCMNGWLKGYYYHITMEWEVFAIVIILSLLITWITIGYKAIKTAIANPVDCLRTE